MKKILLVDDSQDLIDLLTNRLRQYDYTILEAHDGLEGINIVRQERPDLAIFDIIMPNMSGGDAVRDLQDDPLTADIPILFLTSVVNDARTGEEKGVNVGNHFYPAISKPFDFEKFIKKVEDLLNA